MSLPRPSASGWRDAVLFLTGIGMALHETLVHVGPERYGILMLAAGFCGSPVFFRADDRRASREVGE